jgi:SNF2 family DNA or RNA helicase
MDAFMIELKVDGDLKGVTMDRLWECILSKRAFLELESPKSSHKKPMDKVRQIPKILVLNLEEMQSIAQLFDELGIQRLENHKFECPIWSLANIDASNFEGLPVDVKISEKLLDIRRQMLGEKKLEFSNIPEEIKAELRTYQKEGVQWLERLRGMYLCGILADDMGLGKTTSTIIAALESGAKKVLIICPASLKINWSREIENYTDKSIYICEGKNFSSDHDFVIVNYDIIKNFHDIKDKETSQIINSKFDLVIIDEAHYIKNSQAQRTKLINHFVKNINRLWLLTGTPITSRPIDYYNLLSLVESPVAQNWMAYVIRFCEGYQFRAGQRKVWNVNGASNLDELRERTSKQILRRLKTDVLDLPEKIINPVYLRLKSKEYENLMGEYFDWFRNNKEESSSLTVQFSKLMKVRQVIAEEKVSQTIELAENILEQGKKVIIFSNFTEPLKRIHEHFGKMSVYLDGSSTKPARQKAVDDFQDNDKVKVFCGNIKAAGVGITLTSAEVVIFNDLSFVPSDHSQAEDRAYRYGQKNSVLVYYPLFENTIEGAIYDILIRKKGIFETVMGDNLDRGSIAELILNSINGHE